MRVVFSPTHSGAGGNPYVEHLSAGLARAGVDVEPYRRRAILSAPDAVHINWPAFVVDWSDRRRAVSEAGRTLAYLAIARARGTRIVWTAHDLGAHDRPLPRLQRVYERAFASLVTDVVSLTAAGIPLVRAAFPEVRGARFYVIPHGHYRDDYPDVAASRVDARRRLGLPEDGRIILQFGMLRRYKAIEAMIAQFGRLAVPGTTLLVVGESREAAYTAELQEAVRGVPGVLLRTERVDEETAALLMTAADVVYAAYPPGTSLNSGVAVLALSFDRPVVVRDTPVMRELRDVAGADWVFPAETGHDAPVLREALAAGARMRDASVDLRALDWDGIVSATAAVYAGTATPVDDVSSGSGASGPGAPGAAGGASGAPTGRGVRAERSARPGRPRPAPAQTSRPVAASIPETRRLQR